MPASSSLIVDMGTVLSNGPTAATAALAIRAAGPIQDYAGNTQVAQQKLKEASATMTQTKAATDSGDSNLTNINKILAALNGTSTPSTTLITDLNTVITAGPTAATSAKAIAATGPIMDYLGMLYTVLNKLKDAKALVTTIKAATDAGDTSLTQLNNVLTALA